MLSAARTGKSILPFTWLHRPLSRYLAIRCRGHTYLGQTATLKLNPQQVLHLRAKAAHFSGHLPSACLTRPPRLSDSRIGGALRWPSPGVEDRFFRVKDVWRFP